MSPAPLDEVLEEYLAVRGGLIQLQRLLADQGSSGRYGTDRRSVNIARDRLDGTYLVRLFAAFEDELQTLIGNDDLTLRRLIDEAGRSPHISEELVKLIHGFRRERNAVAHGVKLVTTSVEEARRSMKVFLKKCRPQSRR